MDNNNMEDDSMDNNAATSLLDGVLPSLAEKLSTYISRSRVEGMRPEEWHHRLQQYCLFAALEIVATLLSILAEFPCYPPGVAFLIRQDPGSADRFSLEICNEGEAASLVVNGASLAQVSALIRGVLDKPESRDFLCWRRQLRRIDPCPCGHAFHRFVRDTFLEFLATPADLGAAVGDMQEPLLRIRYNSSIYRQSQWLPFLLAFHAFVVKRACSNLQPQQHSYMNLLKRLILQAVATTLRTAPEAKQPADLPDHHGPCPAVSGVDPVFAGVNNSNATVASAVDDHNHTGSVLLASRSQSDIEAFGDSAGAQCMAMAAMAARLHQMLQGTFIGMTFHVLDAILDVGNRLYLICRSNTGRRSRHQHLDFDELTAGMRLFDRQGWPEFRHELSAKGWTDLELGVRARFDQRHDSDDGFILIVNGKVVAVMRDRHSGYFYLFDSHGSDQLLTVDANGQHTRPAYLMRFRNIPVLMMHLHAQFGAFSVCEVHTYRCRYSE